MTEWMDKCLLVSCNMSGLLRRQMDTPWPALTWEGTAHILKMSQSGTPLQTPP